VEFALKRVAKNLGRHPGDVAPHIEQLKQNWYDDIASLSGVNQDDLVGIGIPLRIAKELLREVSGGADDEFPRRTGKDKGKDKGKGKDRDKKEGVIKAVSSKSKGKGKKETDEPPARVHDIPVATEGVDDDFPWKFRILGEKRKNVEHIQKETGVRVWLKGKGAGDSDEALTLSITASDEVADKDFDRALEMCEDLLTHISEEAVGWTPGEDDDDSPGGKGKKGKGKSKKGKSDGKGKDKGKKRSWQNDDGGSEPKRRK